MWLYVIGPIGRREERNIECEILGAKEVREWE